jgi:integrase
MAYTDLKAFKASNITEVKGMKVYLGKRAKTGQTFTIPLLQEALDILKKYRNKLPIISNVKYNEYLKVVAQAAGIDKPISSHWARHTGATLLLNEGGFDLKIVAKILGHSTIRITEQVYAKLLDETVVDEMKKYEEKLIKKIKKK